MKKKRYKVKEIYNLGTMCPTQWEGVLEDDTPIYIRYRFGYLSIRTNPFTSQSEQIFGEQIGDDMDGVLSTSELIKETSKILNWKEFEYLL